MATAARFLPPFDQTAMVSSGSIAVYFVQAVGTATRMPVRFRPRMSIWKVWNFDHGFRSMEKPSRSPKMMVCGGPLYRFVRLVPVPTARLVRIPECP